MKNKLNLILSILGILLMGIMLTGCDQDLLGHDHDGDGEQDHAPGEHDDDHEDEEHDEEHEENMEK